MDIKTIVSVFTMIFLAELGDKTQLATLAFSAGESSKISVFLGSALALIATSAIATLFGGIISYYVPISFLHKAAGVTFIAFGAMYLFKN
ncbi:MAG: TMEM165/GDT1 family protein [Nitrospinae bacterium]|nr:TMEM165/GDT1 family protein [Nitrospinota bacterium]